MMKNESKEFDLMFLGSFIDSIDDVRSVFGDEYAEAFALRIVYFGVRRLRFNDLNSICNATLESIYPKIEKSSERATKTKKAALCKKPTGQKASTKKNEMGDFDE